MGKRKLLPDPIADAIAWARSLSPFGHTLLRKWAWGKLSAPDLQELAAAAQQSGLQDEATEEFAAFGARGRASQNVQRDLVHGFGSQQHRCDHSTLGPKEQGRRHRPSPRQAPFALDAASGKPPFDIPVHFRKPGEHQELLG